MAVGPPLPARNHLRIEIWASTEGSAAWDGAVWGESEWARADWRDITPQSLTLAEAWGTDRPEGVLSLTSAGAWTINTYDPERKLDPSNPSSSYATGLHAGRPIRIRYVDTSAGINEIVRTGVLDTVSYNFQTKVGRIEVSDGVNLLVAGKLLPGVSGAPTTLRARARWAISRCGLSGMVNVESDPVAPDLVQNRSFEQGMTGWSGTTGMVAVGPSSNAVHGTNVMRITANGTTANPQASQIVPVDVGKTYYIRAYGWRGSGTPDVRLRIDTTLDGATVVANVAFVQFTANEPEQKTIQYTIPAGVDGLKVVVLINGTAANGNVAGFDLVSVTDKAFVSDPEVGPYDSTKEQTAWAAIASAALDCVHFVWIDRNGSLRFRDAVSPIDSGLQLGGADGIAMESLETETSLQAVYTRVVAVDAADHLEKTKDDLVGQARYGILTMRRAQLEVPNALVWAEKVIADRGGAALQYIPGTLRIQTNEQLLSLVNLMMGDIVTIAVDSSTPPLLVSAVVLGGSLDADVSAGWSGRVVAYVPWSTWQQGVAPPPDTLPPIDPGDPPTHTITRTLTATKDSRAARTPSGSNYGSGTEGELPVGAWQGWRNRSFIEFPTIDWTGIVYVTKATLRVRTSTQVNIGFGSAPKVIVKRVTKSWSEGSASSPSGGNALVYPGPSVTASGSVTKSVTKSESTNVDIDITNIVRQWAPEDAGGGGAADYGIGLFSAGEDSEKYTTEFWSAEHGSNAPQLILELLELT